MGDEATDSVSGSGGGIFQSLLNAVVQYKSLEVAQDRARTDTSGGYARATDGSLVQQRTQQPVTTAGGAMVPVWVWVVGALGLGLVLVAVVKR